MENYEVLEKCAEVIRLNGWVRDAGGWAPTGPVCAEGALMRVLGLTDTELVDKEETYQVMLKYVGREDMTDGLWVWNDFAKDREVVIEAFEMCALIERTKMGDIGKPVREIEYEPLTAPSVPEPVRAPAPEREPEPVPA